MKGNTLYNILDVHKGANTRARDMAGKTKTPFLVANHGVGKSSMIKGYAQYLEEMDGLEKGSIKVMQVNTANVDATTLNGSISVITEHKETTQNELYKKSFEGRKKYGQDLNQIDIHKHTEPQWVTELWASYAEGNEVILILDEFNRAQDQRVINSMMNLLSERTYGPNQEQLPPNLFIIAAGNPDNGDYSVGFMDSATKGRFSFISAEPVFSEWKLWAEKEDFHKATLMFLEDHPTFFYYAGDELDETGGERNDTGMNPRDWEAVSHVLFSIEDIIQKNKIPEKEQGIFVKMMIDTVIDTKIAAKFTTYYLDNFNSISLTKLQNEVLSNKEIKSISKKIKKGLDNISESFSDEEKEKALSSILSPSDKEKVLNITEKLTNKYEKTDHTQLQKMLLEPALMAYDGNESNNDPLTLSIILNIVPTEKLAVIDGIVDNSENSGDFKLENYDYVEILDYIDQIFDTNIMDKMFEHAKSSSTTDLEDIDNR